MYLCKCNVILGSLIFLIGVLQIDHIKDLYDMAELMKDLEKVNSTHFPSLVFTRLYFCLHLILFIYCHIHFLF